MGKKKRILMGGIVMFVGISMWSSDYGDRVRKEESVVGVVETPEDGAYQQYVKEEDKWQRERIVTNQESTAWRQVLVNSVSVMEENYVPPLAEIEYGYQFDVRALPYLKKMLEDGRKEGMNFWICSAYRSVNKQTELFNNKINQYIQMGDSYQEALEKTKEWIAPPNTSEHALGLAVDIVDKDYQLLDEKQAQTEEAVWLQENCSRYGFILRYPVDKKEITNIMYEPWHYRYVGVTAASEIMNKNITLEEYVKNKQE